MKKYTKSIKFAFLLFACMFVFGIAPLQNAGTHHTTVLTAQAKTKKKKIKTIKVNAKQTMLVGKRQKIKVIVNPSPISKKITYKSSNKKIAYVNSKGVIKALKKGTCKITIMVKSKNKKKKTIKIKVKKRQSQLSDVDLDEHDIQMRVGDKGWNGFLYDPDDAKVQYMIWKSSNPVVLSIVKDREDKGGCYVTGLKAGTATLTVIVKRSDGKILTDKCIYHVLPKSYNMKYNYKVHFINQPYDGIAHAVYIETNNPDPDSFAIEYYNSADKYTGTYSCATSYNDLYAKRTDVAAVPDSDTTAYYKVTNGYVCAKKLEDAGQYTIKIREFNEGCDESYFRYSHGNFIDNYAEKHPDLICPVKVMGKITCLNYDQEYEQWTDNIIQKLTTSSMTNAEKMNVISDYLKANSKYLKNFKDVNGEMNVFWLLSDSSIPFWINYEWDSFTTPSVLKHIGEKLGYNLENLYGKYEMGSFEWKCYHYYVYSPEDDLYFECCPYSYTNCFTEYKTYNDIPKFNFQTYDSYYDPY